jgi:outer membrane murein-binding lipoprotein Lpp
MLLLAALAAAPAGAVVYGGSNFGAYEYPSHNCGLPPMLPQRPYDMSSVRDVEAYNRQVDAYNTQMRSFSECINAYVDRTEKDMQRIREKAGEAIEEMRRANQQSQQRGWR